MSQDQIITCQNCNQQFVWTTGEQEFFAQKNLEAPKMCMICRSLLKTAQNDQIQRKNTSDLK